MSNDPKALSGSSDYSTTSRMRRSGHPFGHPIEDEIRLVDSKHDQPSRQQRVLGSNPPDQSDSSRANALCFRSL